MPRMGRKTVVLSVNASWNIVNFRMGLIEGLQREGFRVVALAPEDAYSPLLATQGVEFVPLSIDNQGISPINDLVLMARYRSALARIGPDVFLGYTIKPNIYGSLAARSLGIKVINNVSGLGTAFIRQGLLTRIVTRLYRFALAGSATVFFQNRDDRDLFVGQAIVRAGQARLLPGSGIDLVRFAPVPRPAHNDEIRFLFVGRLLWDKGVREYVEAARQVRKLRPQARFRMLGLVDAPNRTAVSRSELQSWVDEGVIEHFPACDDVRPYIADADCIVLPSYREGLPRTLLEGAAMAKPLIASDVPGCRDVVEPGVNGLLCAVRDPEALAEAMIRMVDLGAVARAEMGQRGRAKVEAGFGQDIIVARYLDAIGHALKTGQSS